MAAGYLAGRWREGYDIVSSLVPPLLTGALCAVSAAAYGLLQLTLGVDAQVSVLALREVVVQGLLGVLLAVPVLPARPARPPAGPGRRHARPPRARLVEPAGPLLDEVLRMTSASSSRSSSDVPPRGQPPDDLAVRVPRRRARRHRAGRVRRDLLPPLVPRGALRRGLPEGGEREPRPRDQGFRPRAARSSTATATSLVENRVSLSLQVRPDKMFEDSKEREAELSKLAKVADMPKDRIKEEIREQTNLLPASPVTLEEKVDEELVFYLRERQDEFPGVTADQVYVRDYPNGALGVAPVRLRQRGQRGAARGAGLRRPRTRRPDRRRPASRRSTTTCCAAATARRASRSTRAGTRAGGRSRASSRGPATTWC